VAQVRQIQLVQPVFSICWAALLLGADLTVTTIGSGPAVILDRIGDKWSVFAVVELSSGVRRFSELCRALHGIPQRMLTLTLRRLERDGLVLRAVYATVPAIVTYELTDVNAA
jgi:DNA-binding transcriptional ArsR family regulator